MKNTLVLEMLNDNKIEELKTLLSDEIYKDSLKGRGDAKKRYAAMKKFFKYVTNPNAFCRYPCEDIKIGGENYNAFVDGYCFALTKESIGEMEVYDRIENGEYVKMDRLVNRNDCASVDTVDINGVLAEAKVKGYRYKKSEDGTDFRYMIQYKDATYKISFLDKSFGIINDGKPAKVYYKNRVAPLLIETSIGIAGVMPFHCANDNKLEKVNMDEAVV